jgi:IMP dehydrogenase/GMP reductase
MASRLRLVADALVVGALVGSIAVPVLIASGLTTLRAAELAFAVGALGLGIGLLGWSGSVMMGRGVETGQEHLDGDSDWTERKSRRAMARLGGFGGGVMLGSALVEVVAFGA